MSFWRWFLLHDQLFCYWWPDSIWSKSTHKIQNIQACKNWWWEVSNCCVQQWYILSIVVSSHIIWLYYKVTVSLCGLCNISIYVNLDTMMDVWDPGHPVVIILSDSVRLIVIFSVTTTTTILWPLYGSIRVSCHTQLQTKYTSYLLFLNVSIDYTYEVILTEYHAYYKSVIYYGVVVRRWPLWKCMTKWNIAWQGKVESGKQCDKLDLQSIDCWFDCLPVGMWLCNNSGQVVHALMPLSRSSMI